VKNAAFNPTIRKPKSPPETAAASLVAGWEWRARPSASSNDRPTARSSPWRTWPRGCSPSGSHAWRCFFRNVVTHKKNNLKNHDWVLDLWWKMMLMVNDMMLIIMVWCLKKIYSNSNGVVANNVWDKKLRFLGLFPTESPGEAKKDGGTVLTKKTDWWFKQNNGVWPTENKQWSPAKHADWSPTKKSDYVRKQITHTRNI